MNTTTIAARGDAEDDYDIATFSITISAQGDTAAMAKQYLNPKVAKFIETLTSLTKNESLFFLPNSIKVSSSLHKEQPFNHKNGAYDDVRFIADYSHSFSINEMDKVSKVYDVLTSLDYISVAAPAYSLRNKEELEKKALEKAFKKVQSRFADECKVLGLDAAHFVISSWEATYSDSHRNKSVDNLIGSAYAASARGGSAPAFELVVGLATVEVNLEVRYQVNA